MIIIHPFAKQLRNWKENAKNYPYWEELIMLINQPIIQIWVEWEKQLVKDFRKNLSIKELEILIKKCKTWVSIDSFFQHLARYNNKPWIVLWGKWDPKIFWHDTNINLIWNIKNIRKNQFDVWENEECDKSIFVKPEKIVKYL